MFFLDLGVTFPHGRAAKKPAMGQPADGCPKIAARERLPPPRGHSNFSDFWQFLLVDKYVKQKVNGESSTSEKRVALLAPTASGKRPQLTA
jgi:hypothetical protein